MNKIKEIYYTIKIGILDNQIEKNKKLMAFYANTGDMIEYPASLEKQIKLKDKKTLLENKLLGIAK